MIGGLSWVSTAGYYERLNNLAQAALGGVSSAHLVLESVNREEYAQYVYHQGDEVAAGRMIESACMSVAAAGAAFIVISCNDVHRFVPQIENKLSIPFLHIADATAEEIKRVGASTVALLGVRKTMELDFYPAVLAKHGIKTMILSADERDFIDDTIMNEMVAGQFLPETRAKYIDLIESLHNRGAEGVILGCTEIPLLLNADDTKVPLFSTTDLHCQAAIKLALAA